MVAENSTSRSTGKATSIFAGTSGYSYKEWRGEFYPERLASDEWLSFYASRLPSVEINNTFYRMPRKHVVESWRDSVPDGFRFVLKASRRITHQSRLRNAEESTGYLLERTAVLGNKLGAILFQLPPNMRADLDRLRSFQDLLPDSVPVAFEFRHESWLESEVSDALQERGHARVVSHDTEGASADLLTGPLVYLRLRAMNYTDAALRRWHGRIAETSAMNAFVFFKHEDAGAGPKMAARFLALAGDAKQPPKAASKVAQQDSQQPVTQTSAAALNRSAPRRAGPRKAARNKRSS